jgi:hypothetical protein
LKFIVFVYLIGRNTGSYISGTVWRLVAKQVFWLDDWQFDFR